VMISFPAASLNTYPGLTFTALEMGQRSTQNSITDVVDG